MTNKSSFKVWSILYLIIFQSPQALALHASPTITRTMPIIQSVIQDNLMFMKDHGVFVEPSGFAYTYSTFIYETVHLIIPDRLDIDYHISQCSEDQNHQNFAERELMIKNVMTALRNRIPEYSSPFLAQKNTTRGKRELVTLALLTATGLVSLGISLYNTVQIKSVARQSESIIGEVNRISSSQASTTYAVRKLTEGFNNLSTVVLPAIESQIHLLTHDVSCQAMRGQYFRELNRRLTQDLFVTVTSGINALYNGKVTPDFLPPSEIRSKLLTRPDMEGSIYNTDPTLIYQLGKFLLLSVNHHPLAISGMLIIPRLLKEYVGIVLSINRVPISVIGSSELKILDSPDLAVKEMSTKKLWTPNFDTCIKHTGTYYCPLHEIRAKYSHCLTDMMFKQNITMCRYQNAEGYPQVRQTTAGVLVSSAITDYVSIHADADGNRKSTKQQMPNKNASNFLTLKDGSEIMINHDIYLLSSDTAEIILQINDSFTMIDLPTADTNIPGLSPIVPPEQFTPHYLTQGWSYSNLIILLIVVAVLGYIIHQVLMIKQQLSQLRLYAQTNGLDRSTYMGLLHKQ